MGVGVGLWVKMWDFGPAFQTRKLLLFLESVILNNYVLFVS